MFPTVLDLLNISVFIFSESIKLIIFDVSKFTFIKNQSYFGVILRLFIRSWRDYIEKIKFNITSFNE
ncbi:hypothetical protein DSM107003_00800 [Trichormus variabilis SAG 1403-4b]|uniref:Uncharacterized protein n=1 Tax=Trichormus variabilis SAG 1403-4b TaxID=447716 RepID=A0A3S1CWJ6_ANAVA|nr:hypothetical protein DSM107003_00800 [Trichormus variabilis SAG 1403-4b]